MTVPQLEWALSTLSEVKRMEGGEASEESSTEGNTLAAEGVYGQLKKATGRTTFTLDELEDPQGTVRKHKEGVK